MSCQKDEILSTTPTDTIIIYMNSNTYKHYNESGLQITLTGDDFSITKDLDSLSRCVFEEIPPGTYTATTIIRDSIKIIKTGIQAFGISNKLYYYITVYPPTTSNISNLSASIDSKNSSLIVPDIKIDNNIAYSTNVILYMGTSPDVNLFNAKWQYYCNYYYYFYLGNYTPDFSIGIPEQCSSGTTLYLVAYPINRYDAGFFNYETGFDTYTSLGTPSKAASILIP